MSDVQTDLAVTFTSSLPPVPAGIYRARFAGFKQLPAREGMNEAVRWIWVVLDGVHAGREIDNVGSKMPTSKNVTGRLLQGMGVQANVSEAIGKVFTCVVGPNSAGRNVVQSATN